MSAPRLEYIQSFDACFDKAFLWPNSVAVFDDGRIAVADGGNNRVCVLGSDGKSHWEHDPGAGFGAQNLREPIYVGVAPDQSLFVSDWHNHRFVIFDSTLKFMRNLFHMGPIEKSSFLYRLELFVKHLMTRSVGAPYYFSFDKMGKKSPKKADYSLKMLAKGVFYYVFHPKALFKVFFNQGLSVRKANGVIFRDKSFIITQKANRCLSEYADHGGDVRLKRHIVEHNGLDFGRLCNLAQGSDGRIYVCDQNNWRISVLDRDLNAVDDIHFEKSDDAPMAPFSCAIIDGEYIAAARSFGIEIKRLSDHKSVYSSHDLGETHGIAYDSIRSLLYYVDRSNSKIVQFKVSGAQ